MVWLMSTRSSLIDEGILGKIRERTWTGVSTNLSMTHATTIPRLARLGTTHILARSPQNLS